MGTVPAASINHEVKVPLPNCVSLAVNLNSFRFRVLLLYCNVS